MFLMFGGCKKEAAHNTPTPTPATSLVDSVVGIYHVSGVRVAGNTGGDFSRNDTILSGGANTIFYKGTFFHYNSSDSSAYYFDATAVPDSFVALITFPRPLNDSIYYQDEICPTPATCGHTNFWGKKIP